MPPSNVILQPKDWRDWYRVRDWLAANAPEGYRLRSVQDGVPAAFEYPARYQVALMQFLYPEAYPVTPESPAGFVQPPPKAAPGAPGGPPQSGNAAPVERVGALPPVDAPPAVPTATGPVEPARAVPSPAAPTVGEQAKRNKSGGGRPTGGPGSRK